MFEFENFYGNEAEQYAYYSVPKPLFTDSKFKSLSTDSKLLYSFLLDRAGLSVKNNLIDEDGKVFVYFKMEELCERLSIGKDKAVKLFNELDGEKGGIGLIKRKRQGQGKPIKIYVMNFMKLYKNSDFGSDDVQTSENQKSEKKQKKTEVLTSEKPKSKGRKIRSLKVGKSEVSLYNKPDINNLSISNLSNLSYQDITTDVRTDLMKEKIDMIDFKSEKEKIYNQVEFDKIEAAEESVEELVNLIAWVNLTNCDAITINGLNFSIDIIREQFSKLRKNHIEYVIDCLNNNQSKIRNRRKYLLTCLFNAPTSFEANRNKGKPAKKKNSYNLEKFEEFALNFSLYNDDNEKGGVDDEYNQNTRLSADPCR